MDQRNYALLNIQFFATCLSEVHKLFQIIAMTPHALLCKYIYIRSISGLEIRVEIWSDILSIVSEHKDI